MENYVEIGTTILWTHISDTINKDKPYICLCGGGPGIGDSLSEIDDLLKFRFNIIRFEQRGCGRSTKDGNYLIETTIDDVDKIRKFYKIDSWYILGHSWGAGIALFYANKYKNRCKGVVYISGMGIQNDNDWSEEFNNNSKNLKEPEINLPENFQINYDVTNAGLRSYNQYIKSPTLLKDISILNIPVLIICGKKDIRPIWPAIQLSNLLPDCTLKIFDECNHFPWKQNCELLKDTIFLWFNDLIK